MSDIRYWVDRGISGHTYEIKKVVVSKETPKTIVCQDAKSSFKWEQHLRKSEEFVFVELAHAQEKYVELVQRKIEFTRNKVLELEADMAKHLEESKGLA